VILVSAAGTHARIPWLVPPHAAAPFSPARVVREMREALANRNFRFFFLAVLSFLVGRGFSDGLGIFMGTYFWELEKEHIFLVTAVALAGIGLGTPLWAALVRWYEKRTIFLAGCVALGGFTAVAPVLKIMGFFPSPQSPAYLPLIYAAMLLTALGAAGAVAVPGAMLADVADEHELATGRRQEGIFFGALSFSGKAATGMGAWMAGLALQAIRFPKPEAAGTSVAPGSVDPDVLVALGLIAGPGIAIFAVLGIWLAARYRLDRRRHAEIVARLPSRGVVAPRA